VMVRPQNLSVSIAGDGNCKLVGRLTDIMVSGSLTKLYMDPVTPGMPPLIAAYPTRASTRHHAIGELLALDWHPADAVAIADEQAA
jgi:putative spermidine/putrescine transport system ATP-binding protein